MGIIEKLLGKGKGPLYRIGWNLSDLQRKIPRLPKQYPAGGFTFGAGKGVAEEQIPIICRNIEQAFTAVETPSWKPNYKEGSRRGAYEFS